MVQSAGGVEAGAAGHEQSLCDSFRAVKIYLE
jgi:hypothetical protein